MTTPERPAAGLRAMTRDAVRGRIASQALLLFDEKGFDETTVDDIVSAVGISPRSFFRYFPNKEDVVVGDLVLAGGSLRDQVAELLQTMSPWASLHEALRAAGADVDADPARWLRTMRVINSTPSLRARNLEKHLAWSALLVPLLLATDTSASEADEVRARALVGSAFACLDAALAVWTISDAATAFVDVVDQAFTAFGPGAGSTVPLA